MTTGISGAPPRLGDDASDAVLRKLQLLVTRKLDGLLHGDYLGLLPGGGSEPGESREYRPGDDVRRMDWPVTARTTVPHIRQTVADRELEGWLAVDLSASLDFGTAQCEKRDLAIAAATACAHLIVRGGNRLGAVVSNGSHVQRWPAGPGRSGAHGLLRRIAATPRASQSQESGDLAAALDSLLRPPRRRGQVCVISDFLAPPGWEFPLRKLGVRHDVLAIEIVDPRELELPAVGVLAVEDPETGDIHEVQTDDPQLREHFAAAAGAQRGQIAAALRRAGAAHLRLRTDGDWLLDIVRFVAARRQHRARGHSGGLSR
ncbi:MAG: DUF58 domain-containing protein [Corynebacteriales bacterium]|nr:DUF58 domain-containing protein [Mycobacteriales bacterium]